MTTISEAIKAINFEAEFEYFNDDLDSITWFNNTTPISKEDIQTKLDELQAAYDAQDYARKRKAEYPDIYDYIDGVVKSDQAQIDKYIADCQAVKDKYSKG
jgi:hypothetical protein